jgi:hypothetical protein
LKGYDEPEILPSSTHPICLTSADGEHSVLAKAGAGLRLNEHIEADGPTVFAHACRMGLEGIVSKRKNSTYRSGSSCDWLKCKNRNCSPLF